MITKDEVLNAIRYLKDRKWNKSMLDLNLVRDIMIRENKVMLTLLIPEDTRPEIKAIYQNEITEAIKPFSDLSVHIRFREMTPFECSEIEMEIGANREPAKSVIPEEKEKALNKRKDVQFFAIASGKGGVGKSTVTVNLALALARRGKKVGIIDADIYGFSIPNMMGIEERPKTVNNTILPVERYGVKVISMGFFVENNSPVIWRGPMLGKMLEHFFTDVVWGDIDFILLDLPPGTGDIALDIHQMLPESKEIIVTTPHATAAHVAARAGTMATQTNHEILGVIENMAYMECGKCRTKEYPFGRGGGAALAGQLKTKLLAQIPLGVQGGSSVEPDDAPSIYKEDSSIGQVYLDVADQIIE